MKKRNLAEFLAQRNLLIIRDEENFAEKFSLGFTNARLLVVVTACLVFLFFSSLMLGIFLGDTFRPVSGEIRIKRQLVALSTVLDSLSEALKARDSFIENTQLIISGDRPKGDLAMKKERIKAPSVTDLDTRGEADRMLRKEFETNQSGKLVSFSASSGIYQQALLLSPIAGGIVSARYDTRIRHFGVDLLAPKDEPIKAIADGTVVMADWTSETGHVITVQHAGNLISVYKHNSVLLKKVGDFIRAGDILAIIGNSGELTTGPHLHFELWHNGNPVDPELYIPL
jgi:murein DD-endopeptidase MepM/ murein hydrolase activator NlpD